MDNMEQQHDDIRNRLQCAMLTYEALLNLHNSNTINTNTTNNTINTNTIHNTNQLNNYNNQINEESMHINEYQSIVIHQQEELENMKSHLHYVIEESQQIIQIMQESQMTQQTKITDLENQLNNFQSENQLLKDLLKSTQSELKEEREKLKRSLRFIDKLNNKQT